MTPSVVATSSLGELAAGLRGDLILPDDPGYDQARAVYRRCPTNSVAGSA
jgi:hypothetical protein